jgi:SAM-dependent methyltransferase
VAAESILNRVEQYYSGRFTAHGATARGVDWNSADSQELRFEQLLKVCEGVSGPVSLNDYGCGYGALVAHLDTRGEAFSYTGFDVSAAMLDHAKRTYAGRPDCEFVTGENELPRADYTVASGILNVKLGFSYDAWEEYVRDTLARLASLSTRGFAFNALTSYSDPELRRDDLYYADPRVVFDHCKRTFSRNVALLHDYGLYEFTTIVRV